MNPRHLIRLAGLLIVCTACVGVWRFIRTDTPHSNHSQTSKSPEERLKIILEEKLQTPIFEGRFCVVESDGIKKTEKRSEKTIQFNGKSADTRRVCPPTSADCLAYLKTRRLPDGWKILHSEEMVFGGSWFEGDEEIEPIELAAHKEGEWGSLIDSDGNELNAQSLPSDDTLSSLLDALNSIPTFPDEEPIVFRFVGLAASYDEALKFFRSRVVALPGDRLKWELTPNPNGWYAKATIVIDEKMREVESAKIVRLGSSISHSLKVLSLKRSRAGKAVDE